MNNLIYAVFLFFALLIQLTVGDLFAIYGITPNFVLIVLTFIGLEETRSKTTVLGFITGFCQDFLGGGILGLYALAKSIAGFVIASFSKNRMTQKLIWPVMIVFVGQMIHNIVLSVFRQPGWDLKWFVISTVYTAVIAVIFFLLFAGKLWTRGRFYEEQF